MRTKPTNFEAAKSVVLIGEEITAEQIINRMLNNGRKEIPTKKSLSVKFRNDKMKLPISIKGSQILKPINYTEKEVCGVGRLRLDHAFTNGLALWAVGDQLWKGAALNAVQIAELAIQKELV